MPPAAEPPRDLRRTREWWRRAAAIVPGGTHTISKRVGQFAPEECFPAFLVRGRGALVWDPDGNEYIDYIAALAPVILGYAHPAVDAAIRAQLDDGILFSLPGTAEVELGERLCRLLPCAERVRLFKTGAEATAAAVRAARLVTGRTKVLSCGYHGWHDWWAVTKYPAGIPPAIAACTEEFAFGDVAEFERKFAAGAAELAAVILTPAVYGRNPPPGFLETIRRRTAEARVPLVFDEIITGFRWGLAGAQGRYGVVPDLACFGKSLANGMPIAALVGRAAWMDPIKDNWISSTYAGELLSIRAALATLDVLEQPGFYEGLHQTAAALRAGLAEIGRRRGVPVVQGDELPALVFRPDVPGLPLADLQTAVLTHAAQRGVLLRRDPAGISLCLMAAHTPSHIERTLAVIDGAVAALLAASVRSVRA
jgi:glutamate-1-semialdehyde aminotransferase